MVNKMILICSCEAPLQSIDGKGELTPCCLKVALNRKGLRRTTASNEPILGAFESSPESEGIKTSLPYIQGLICLFESSPESEGIKTRII